jgi:hypothetical protein
MHDVDFVRTATGFSNESLKIFYLYIVCIYKNKYIYIFMITLGFYLDSPCSADDSYWRCRWQPDFLERRRMIDLCQGLILEGVSTCSFRVAWAVERNIWFRLIISTLLCGLVTCVRVWCGFFVTYPRLLGNLGLFLHVILGTVKSVYTTPEYSTPEYSEYSSTPVHLLFISWNTGTHVVKSMSVTCKSPVDLRNLNLVMSQLPCFNPS